MYEKIKNLIKIILIYIANPCTFRLGRKCHYFLSIEGNGYVDVELVQK